MLKLFLIICAWISVIRPEDLWTEASEGEKSQRRLQRIWKRGNGKAAPLHNGNYTANAMTAPRDYPLAILFTARGPQYNCGACIVFEEQFQEIAAAYMRQPKQKRSGSNAMAFATVDVDDARNAFQMNQFQHIPRLFVLPPLGEESLTGPLLPEWELNLNAQQSMSLGFFVEFLNRRFGIKIKGMGKDDSWALVVGGLLAILWGFVGHFVCKDRKKAKMFFWNKTLWYCISLACYGFGVSGMVYCVIRNPPTHIARGKDMLEMISGEGRGQYVYEGLMIGFSSILSALSILGIFTSCKPKPSRLMVIPRILMFSFCLALLIYSLQFTYTLYTMKTRWYSSTRTLPDQTQQWLSASVKKSSGWAKRIIRISQYYLFEYKSMKSLSKKMNTLIYSYAYRYPSVLASDVNHFYQKYLRQ